MELRGLFSFFLLLLLVGSCSALNNRQKFANKIINMGFKLMDNATIRKICTCMETPVFQMKGQDDLMTAGQSCLLSNIGNLYMPMYTLYTDMDACLKPSKTDSISLVMKIATSNTGLGNKFQNIFKTLMDKIKMWKEKKPKLPKDQVMMNAYGWGIKQFNKSVINQYCTQLVKSGSINKAEWKCALQYGKTVVDFSPYKCATLTPAS